MGAEEQIAQALVPAVRAAGLEIWDIERSGASVRILVERPGGVDLDSISQLSAAVSGILDQRDDLVPAGRYTLEVSSPGLERRLRSPSHFVRYVGEEVAVRTAEAVDGRRRFRGTLTSATDEGITICLADTASPRGREPQGEVEDLYVPLRAIERANAVFNWGPPAKGTKSNRTANGPAKPGRAAAAPNGTPISVSGALEERG